MGIRKGRRGWSRYVSCLLGSAPSFHCYAAIRAGLPLETDGREALLVPLQSVIQPLFYFGRVFSFIGCIALVCCGHRGQLSLCPFISLFRGPLEPHDGFGLVFLNMLTI